MNSETTTATAIQLTRTACEMRAEDLVHEFGIVPKTNLIFLVNKLGGQFRYHDYYRMSSHDLALEIAGEDDFLVYLPTDFTPESERFTIAKALGRYYLHFIEPRERGAALEGLSVDRYDLSHREWEATWFAAALLMPSRLFRKAYLKRKGDAYRTAREFRVSPQHVVLRAKALGLPSQEDLGAARTTAESLSTEVRGYKEKN